MATKTKSQTSELLADAVSMEQLLAASGYNFKGFKRGESVKGKVVEVTGRTVYVDIGGKAEAVVSEQEYQLAKDYFRALKPGDEVTGIVLVTENDAGQVVLSLKRAAVDKRWKELEQALADDSAITVKAKETTKGGLLVDADGIFGFIPTSQFGKDLEGSVSTIAGKPVRVRVIEVDRLANRLVLSEKLVSEAEDIEKKKKALESVKINGSYEGTVVGMVPFGVFVQLHVPGKESQKGEAETTSLEGLVHISEISWEKVDDVSKILKEGAKVTVQVIGVDEDNGKLALSMKRLSADPWLIVAQRFAVDSKHKGVVTKLVPYGVLVRLDKGIEGLIHASKMPAGMAFRDGDEVEVFVESVDLDKRRLSLGVVLSEKPVGYK